MQKGTFPFYLGFEDIEYNFKVYLRYVTLYGIVIWLLVPKICSIFQVYSGTLLTSFDVNKVLYFVLHGTCCSTLYGLLTNI